MKITSLLFVAAWMLACQARQPNENFASDKAATTTRFLSPEQAKMEEGDGLPAPAPQPPPPGTPRQIIRNADLRFRVAEFKTSGQRIEAAVKTTGGMIARANETRSDDRIENELTIRVPAPKLDWFLATALKESIFTDTKTITSEDVTRRYVDLQARVRSKQAAEERYLQLLKQAKTVEDVLKVQQQLDQIREEREVQETELRELKTDVAMSTVNLSYYQQTERARQPDEPFFAQILDNLGAGYGLLTWALLGIFYLLPLLLVGGGLLWLLLRWRRKWRANRA